MCRCRHSSTRLAAVSLDRAKKNGNRGELAMVRTSSSILVRVSFFLFSCFPVLSRPDHSAASSMQRPDEWFFAFLTVCLVGMFFSCCVAAPSGYRFSVLRRNAGHTRLWLHVPCFVGCCQATFFHLFMTCRDICRSIRRRPTIFFTFLAGRRRGCCRRLVRLVYPMPAALYIHSKPQLLSDCRQGAAL